MLGYDYPLLSVFWTVLWLFILGLKRMSSVITSYSIHYTKLYDGERKKYQLPQ